MTYYIATKLLASFEDTLARTEAALKTEGFGVISRIDIQQTLKSKIDVEFRPYTILGACNPTLAHRALSAEIDAGVMLPCNVIIYEQDDGQTLVNVVDPLQTLARESGPLEAIAKEAREKLERVLERLG